MTAIVDLTDQRFGRLTAVRLLPERDKYRRAQWECRCDCGEIVVKSANALNHRTSGAKRCGADCPLRAADYYAPRRCVYCEREYQPLAKNQTMCGDEACTRRFHREWRRAHATRKNYPPRECAVCGASFVPRKWSDKTCSANCRAQRKRDLANARNRGEGFANGHQHPLVEIFCAICGAPTMAHALATTCPRRECVLAWKRIVSRKTKGLKPCRCIVCSTPFWPADRGAAGQHYTCSDECSRIALLRKNRRCYWNNREERLRKLAERTANDPAFVSRRRQVDRESRERKSRLKLLADISAASKILYERLIDERTASRGELVLGWPWLLG